MQMRWNETFKGSNHGSSYRNAATTFFAKNEPFDSSRFLTDYFTTIMQTVSTLKEISARSAKTLFLDILKRLHREKYSDVEVC